jgi:hypothetical protein
MHTKLYEPNTKNEKKRKTTYPKKLSVALAIETAI